MNMKLLFLASIIFSTSSFADLKFCNKTKKDSLTVALARYKDKKILAKGWYNIDKDKCVVLYKGDLTKADSNIYYFYAEAKDGEAVWEGEKKLCVKKPGPFEFKNSETGCKLIEKERYREFTTDDKKDISINLILPKGGSAGFTKSQGDSENLEINDGFAEDQY